MKVKLISYTTPTEELIGDGVGSLHELIAYCARVSNPTNQHNNETADKLVDYLIKHKHFSPLEMVNVCLEIETTRAIARQILRHRSFTFQEFSQRYADPTAELEFVLTEARRQDAKNRQNSIDDLSQEIKDQWEYHQSKIIAAASYAYLWAIENGIAKECARNVLPEGNTLSRLYVNGTLRSWLHYIELRRENGTQKEHMEVAKACADVISKLFPYIKNNKEN